MAMQIYPLPTCVTKIRVAHNAYYKVFWNLGVKDTIGNDQAVSEDALMK